MGEVRARDLHFVDFIKVRLRAVKRIVVERASDVEILSFRSHDYSRNVDITSEWNALLLNKVIVGNGRKLTRGDKSLTAAPAGYDSVSIFILVLLRVR